MRALLPPPIALDRHRPEDLAEAELRARAAELLEASTTHSTRRAYAADWRCFQGWCFDAGRQALPADTETVALYLTALSLTGRKASTIARRLVAIRREHDAIGAEDPTDSALVRQLRRGIRRTLGTRPDSAAPITPEDLRLCLDSLPGTLVGRRDRAAFLLGFYGALRRSELVGLDVSDLQFSAGWVDITIRRSKTDAEGRGEIIALAAQAEPRYCPVAATKAWLSLSGIRHGPLLRALPHGRLGPTRLRADGFNEALQHRFAAVGRPGYSAHGLRHGLATAAARAGVPARDIMRQTRHKSLAMVERYIAEAERHADNVTSRIRL